MIRIFAMLLVEDSKNVEVIGVSMLKIIIVCIFC